MSIKININGLSIFPKVEIINHLHTVNKMCAFKELNYCKDDYRYLLDIG